MYLYVYQDFQGGLLRRSETDRLIRQSAGLYAAEASAADETVRDFSHEPVERTQKGKPYFPGDPLSFSVSHTGKLWVCLMGRQTMGVDVQKVRRCRMEKIAERYYTPDEQAYIQQEGEWGFFQIWARKEAYAKFTGEGMTEKLRLFSTLKDGHVSFVDFNIMEGVAGACCIRNKEELWIRQIK
ncbi:MAG: 4'-phosphopantetheinyl transferase superfamily protein [Firmicutes bacterium]|nr:4'-phosphopantetheinyl transferase superfamily protein [Bacillota bacterium]